jgi:hypothetical protein
MTRWFTLCWLAVFAVACSDGAPEPWNPAEMSALSEQFAHIAEAYAVVDVCMPMIAADKDAKFNVISKIEVRHFTQLSQMDTESEFANFIAHHRKNAGTDEQVATLARIYRESHRAATQQLTSIDGCVETVTDYANTILNTKVRPAL